MTGLIAVAVLAVMLPSFLNGCFFVGGGDVKTQWFPFYILNRRETVTAIKNMTMPFYSFVLFLGNNIWASKASYGLFDIYNVLSYVLDADYFAIYDIQLLIKILVSGIAFYLFIIYVYDDKKTAFITGLCYALSSYALYYTSQPGFLSFYSLVPLYFLGMEEYLKENRKYLFIIMVFLLLLTNFYFFYAVSLFSPVWFIYRYLNLNKTAGGLIKKALKLICWYLVGVLLSGIVIVPVFLYIIENERVGWFNTGLFYKDIALYFHLFTAAFIPNHTYIYAGLLFDQQAHTLKEICVYAGSLITLLVPQILTDDDRYRRYTGVFLYIMLLFFLFTPISASVFNGFSEPCFRWLFLFVMADLFVAAGYLRDISQINKRNLYITAAVETLLIVICVFADMSERGMTVTNCIWQLSVFGLCIVFIVVHVFYLVRKNNAFVSLLVVELLVFASVFGWRQKDLGISREDYRHLSTVLADDYNGLSAHFDDLDPENATEFYRIYVPYDSIYWSFSHNMGILYGLRGLMTYDSTFAPSFVKMRRLNYDSVVNVMDWQFDIKDTGMMNMLSTKYAITVSEEEIPFEEYEIIEDDYRGSLIVSVNKNYRHFGTIYDKSLTYDELKNIYNNDTDLLCEYVVTDSDISFYLKGNKGKVYGASESVNDLNFKADCEEDSFIVISLPYDKGWNISVNGDVVPYFECNGGLIGIPLKQGHSEIVMSFVPDGLEYGLVFSAVGALVLFTLIIIDARKRRRV